MRHWFEWNGVRCTNYGIVVRELPSIAIPQERTTSAKVPGRAGSLTVPEGDDVYSNFDMKASCYVRNANDIAVIADWLRGSGTVTFANRPDGYYKARVSKSIEFKRILRGSDALSFDLTFDCQPFFYMRDVAEITFSTTLSSGAYVGTATIIGQGSVFAEPVIKVDGSGDYTLTIGDAVVYIRDIDGAIWLDCDAGIAYTVADGALVFAGSHISIEESLWPRLEPGGVSNSVTIESTSTGAGSATVTIQPGWRCL